MKVRMLSMNPVKFGKWYIKPSSTNMDSICIIFHNVETHEFLIRFFSNEIEANLFTERIVYDSESEEPNPDTL